MSSSGRDERKVIRSPFHSRWLFEPQLIRIGVSRYCNHRCLMCWNYSTLLKTSRKQEWRMVKIDKELALRTIRDASDLGFRRVLFSGSGEPFTHPNMNNFIEESTNRKLSVIIQTNMSLVDPKELVERLADMKEKSTICVNVGASDCETYMKIHQNVGKKDFYNILNKIRFLLKNNVAVRFVFVVTKYNYKEIESAFALSNNIGSFLHLELADFVPGEGIEKASLSDEEKREIIENFSCKANKANEKVSNMRDFLNQIQYRGIGIKQIKRCLIGHNFCAVNEIANVHYCFNRSSGRFFMGDLNRHSLKEIWFSHNYNRMRKRLKRGKFFRECRQYCTGSSLCNDPRSSNFKIRFYIDQDIPTPWV